MDMPIMKPIQIEDANSSLWKKLKVWLTVPRKWEIVKGYYFTLRNGYIVYIPAKFIFDGASNIRVLWWLLSPTGILFIPGLIHDYGYRNRCINVIYKGKSKYIKVYQSRENCDRMFREVSEQVNGLTCISWLAWLALRLFGWKAWKEDKKKYETEN